MNIYFSGLGGVGIGPLTQIARDAGHTVLGSDLKESPLTKRLQSEGVLIDFTQDGSFLRSSHQELAIDRFVYTSALPEDSPELTVAKELGIPTSKRDAFLAEFIELHQLKLLAIAGTHGKTTTTSLFVWALQRLNIPVSYSVGATLSFGPSGVYVPGSDYFVYECDEFDRNFLHFSPYISLITSIDYDHPDTYPTPEDYTNAFTDYMKRARLSVIWQAAATYCHIQASDTVQVLEDGASHDGIALVGEHNRRNALLVLRALELLGIGTENERLRAINSFPGADRRFEKLADNLYSDYGHHPVEIRATLQMAKERAASVVLVYQPHQNIRQHHIQHDYTDELFANASHVIWLPTYLSREDPSLPLLDAHQLTKALKSTSLSYGDLDDETWHHISDARQNGSLVLLMGAGSIDSWAREKLTA